MSDFKAKMHQIRFRFFGWGSAPDPAGGAYSAPPDPLAGFGGPTSKEREREGMGRGGRGGERRRGKGREEGGGEGVGAPFNVLPPGATDLVAPLEVTLF